MIKMYYGDAAHQKTLENRFVSLLDDETNRHKEWTVSSQFRANF